MRSFTIFFLLFSGLLLSSLWLDFFMALELTDIPALLVFGSVAVSSVAGVGMGMHIIENEKVLGTLTWGYGLIAGVSCVFLFFATAV